MSLSSEPLEREYQESRFHRRSWLLQLFKPLPSEADVAGKTVSEKDLEDAFSAADDADATLGMLLQHAEHLKSSREERGRAAEARATTLLGTVPIAASLLIAGSGLILDDRVKPGWSVPLMGLVVLLLLLLLMCGFTASRAVLKVRIQAPSDPRMRKGLKWATSPDVHSVRVDRVKDVVQRADDALYVAEYKRAQLKVAYYWYRAALLCFGLLGVTLLSYAIAR